MAFIDEQHWLFLYTYTKCEVDGVDGCGVYAFVEEILTSRAISRY